MDDSIDIRAIVGETRVSRDQVRAWESRRMKAVLARFAARLGDRAAAEIMPDTIPSRSARGPLDVQRSALTTAKMRLGHAGIYAMLKRDLALSERMARIGVAMSRGRSEYAVARLEVPNYSAGHFADWFDNLTVSNAETDMVDACPDHYLLRGLPDGRQEVVETTGGSPTASRFLVDYSRSEALTIPVDPDYPLQIAGQALLDDGLVIGGVRHQFRDRDGTLEAVLTVQFPATLPARLIHQHQWHLACEFSNWVIAAASVAATS
ncbi:hypothetical protein IU427_24545 [Nocardia beijingensis]|uniref:hypothetical protein n=1 Tax=Nocardia beijingensis TaxID=95162 RepID=UPI0018952C97|nr:hypothetical protein [Nocardia beijingensis]MBF6468315.1 hypothetical protein [Nocardia beijingensis]